MIVVHSRSGAGQVCKRLFDIAVAATALVVLAPVLIVAAVGIRFSSPGPVLYVARRAGRGGTSFAMLKLRTMHPQADGRRVITAPGDKRIFGFGLLLRRLKIDEVPQFWNILTGDLSLVGPRPEDPKIVDRDYTDWMKETLLVTPGVTGPGAVFGYVFGEDLLDEYDPEGSYVRNLLPAKLALERAYLQRASFVLDLGYLLLTVRAIAAHVLGRKVDLPAVDVAAAQVWAPQGRYPSARS